MYIYLSFFHMLWATEFNILCYICSVIDYVGQGGPLDVDVCSGKEKLRWATVAIGPLDYVSSVGDAGAMCGLRPHLCSLLGAHAPDSEAASCHVIPKLK